MLQPKLYKPTGQSGWNPVLLASRRNEPESGLGAGTTRKLRGSVDQLEGITVRSNCPAMAQRQRQAVAAQQIIGMSARGGNTHAQHLPPAA